MALKGKYLPLRRKSDAPRDHGGPASRSTVYLAIAIIGVLVITLQIYSGILERSRLRGDQIAAIHQQIAASNAANAKRSLDFTCTLLTTIPPDHGLADALRTKLKCGTYIPPTNSKTKPKPSPAKPSAATSTSRSSTADSASSKGNSVGSTSQKMVAAPTNPASSPASRPSTSPSSSDIAPTVLGIKKCVLIICIT